MTTKDPAQEADGAYSVSFKGGKGYEEPEFVVRANSAGALRSRIIDAFDLDGAGLSLVDIIHNANMHFRALSSVGSGLGGLVIQSSSADRVGGDDPWDTAETAGATPNPPDPNKELLDEIEAATTVDQLRRFWVANQPLNEIVHAAWSAKGKLLEEGNN